MGLFDRVGKYFDGDDGDRSGATKSTIPPELIDYSNDTLGVIRELLFPGAKPGETPSAADMAQQPKFDQDRVVDINDTEQRGLDLAGQSVGQYAPFLNQGANYAHQAAQTASQAGLGAQSLVDKGTSFNAGAIDNYVDPYRSGVVDEIYRLSAENLEERLMPAVNSSFTGAGQFGSSRHQEFASRALRDTQREAIGKSSDVLSGAYNQALSAYGQERSRDLTGAGILSQAGASSAQGMLGASGALMQGATTGQAMSTQDVQNLLMTGGLVRGVDQSQVDADYADFIESRDFPFIQLGMANQVAGGGPYDINYPTVSMGQAPPSMLGQLGGLALAGYGMYNSGMFG